jgi:hypothetical protein
VPHRAQWLRAGSNDATDRREHPTEVRGSGGRVPCRRQTVAHPRYQRIHNRMAPCTLSLSWVARQSGCGDATYRPTRVRARRRRWLPCRGHVACHVARMRSLTARGTRCRSPLAGFRLRRRSGCGDATYRQENLSRVRGCSHPPSRCSIPGRRHVAHKTAAVGRSSWDHLHQLPSRRSPSPASAGPFGIAPDSRMATPAMPSRVRRLRVSKSMAKRCRTI